MDSVNKIVCSENRDLMVNLTTVGSERHLIYSSKAYIVTITTPKVVRTVANVSLTVQSSLLPPTQSTSLASTTSQ